MSPFFILGVYMSLFGSIGSWVEDHVTQPIKNTVESAVETAGKVGSVVTTTIEGGSTRKALEAVGNGVADVNKNLMNTATYGYYNEVDALSGGLLTATDNAGRTGADLVGGKSIKDNLKDAARVGAVIGAAAATGGGSLATQATTTLAVNNALSKNGKTVLNLKTALGAGGAYGTGNNTLDSILQTVGNAGKATPSNQTMQNYDSGYYSTDSGSSQEGVTQQQNNLLPILLISGLAITIILISKK
jgi:hypothetical protein